MPRNIHCTTVNVTDSALSVADMLYAMLCWLFCSVSNLQLGMFGVKEFTAIINPPQTALLSVGCLESAILERENCSVVTSHYITSTLSHDVRAISAELYIAS